MSFKDDYKSEMDNIRTDNYIREKVIRKIEQEQTQKQFKFPIFRVAGAVVCLIVAFAVATPFILNSPDKTTVIPGNASQNKAENVAESYSEIYSKVKELKQTKGLFGGIFKTEEYDTDDYVLDESETTTAVTDKAESTTDGAAANKNYSQTNTQVAGVDEADVVKTDGEYIYSLSAMNNNIRIIKVGKDPKVVATIKMQSDNSYSADMYLSGDRLVVSTSEYDDYTPKTLAVIYDISNPESPERLVECVQDGDCHSSRLIGDKLYLISDFSVNSVRVRRRKPETYVPAIECKDYSGAVPADSVHISEDCQRLIYTVVSAYDIDDGSLCSTRSILGGTYTVYCSTKNIITAGYYDGKTTKITRYSIDDGMIEFKSQTDLNGNLLNQFSIDEYKDYFRFVTTAYDAVEMRDDNETVSIRNTQVNEVYIFDGDLKQVGAIKNLAPNERVYSVRFMGDIAYFVTFRETDPLFSADLSDPENPKIIGKLKIPGFSSYLHPYGDGKLLGIGMDADEKTGRTETVKLSMFDISDPSDVTESAKQILNIDYSEALDNHKAVLIDAKRNIIGFSGYENDGMYYYIYSLQNGKFVLKSETKVKDLHAHSIRGLFIQNELYIVEESALSVYDLESFEIINKIEL